MRAYSMDLRTRVVEAAERKEGTYEHLAARFRVSAAWVKKMVHQWRRLAELVRERPDATLARLRELLGVTCCLRTIWLAVRRLGQSFKKGPAGRRAGPAGRGRRPRPPPPRPAGRPRASALV